jgi:myo-inositol-1(or 4)-monophosphatase
MQAAALSHALATAIQAAHAGGEALRQRFSTQLNIRTKSSPIDLVTDADVASEAAVMAVIKSRHPHDAFLAEESGASGDADNVWIIDALDGTTNYTHAVPHFAVSIGYQIGKTIAVGVIYDPMRDELFAAVKGQGASLNGSPIHTSEVSEMGKAMMATGFPYWLQEKPDGVLSLFGAVARKAQSVRRFGSAALDLAWVAMGRQDGFFEMGLKAWDIAAGSLLVEEAGGKATGLKGEPLSLEQGHICAATAPLHASLIAISAQIDT